MNSLFLKFSPFDVSSKKFHRGNLGLFSDFHLSDFYPVPKTRLDWETLSFHQLSSLAKKSRDTSLETAAHDLIHLHCRGNRFKTCHILSSRIISRHCSRPISKSNNHTFPRNSCCLLSWRGSSSSRHPFFRWPGTREPRLEIRKPSVFPPSTREGITIPRSITLELPLLLFFPLFLPRSIVPPSFPSFQATMSPLNSRHPAARTRNLKFEASINEKEIRRQWGRER